MANVDKEEVRGRLDFLAPEHAGKSDSLKNQAIDAGVDRKINTNLWERTGDLVDGAALIAAHLLTLRERRKQLPGTARSAGQVASISEGELSLSFDTSKGGGSRSLDLESTDYGIAFKDIKDDLPTTPLT